MYSASSTQIPMPPRIKGTSSTPPIMAMSLKPFSSCTHGGKDGRCGKGTQGGRKSALAGAFARMPQAHARTKHLQSSCGLRLKENHCEGPCRNAAVQHRIAKQQIIKARTAAEALWFGSWCNACRNKSSHRVYQTWPCCHSTATIVQQGHCNMSQTFRKEYARLASAGNECKAPMTRPNALIGLLWNGSGFTDLWPLKAKSFICACRQGSTLPLSEGCTRCAHSQRVLMVDKARVRDYHKHYCQEHRSTKPFMPTSTGTKVRANTSSAGTCSHPTDCMTIQHPFSTKTTPSNASVQIQAPVPQPTQLQAPAQLQPRPARKHSR